MRTDTETSLAVDEAIMDIRPNQPHENAIERIVELETALRQEREKVADLNARLAKQKLLINDIARSAEPALEAEYHALMNDYEEGRSIDGDELLTHIDSILKAS